MLGLPAQEGSPGRGSLTSRFRICAWGLLSHLGCQPSSDLQTGLPKWKGLGICPSLVILMLLKALEGAGGAK